MMLREFACLEIIDVARKRESMRLPEILIHDDRMGSNMSTKLFAFPLIPGGSIKYGCIRAKR